MRKAINALIIRDKRILLFKKDLIWILPGGKPEKGESDIGALVREFKEEASGAEIEVGEYYGSFIGMPIYKKDALEAVTYFAELKDPDLRVIPSGEIKESMFIGPLDIILIHLSDITSKIIEKLSNEGYL